MHEFIEKKLEEAIIIVDGNFFYKAQLVKELNDLGVTLHYTKEGVQYSF
ncbi:hypothetical protein H4O14_02395 [Bacillus sp. PAMC26568]|nr:hypothetical protein H4O14_02395 [Bacillus sp. PAMC26568]